jgi:hypothetical protein
LNGIRVDHDDGGAFKAAQVWGNWAARWMTVEVTPGSGGIGEVSCTIRRGSAAWAATAHPWPGCGTPVDTGLLVG